MGWRKNKLPRGKSGNTHWYFLIENPKDAYGWRELLNTLNTRSNRLTLLRKESQERWSVFFFLRGEAFKKKPRLMSTFFSLWLNKNKWKISVVSWSNGICSTNKSENSWTIPLWKQCWELHKSFMLKTEDVDSIIILYTDGFQLVSLLLLLFSFWPYKMFWGIKGFYRRL